MQNENQNQNNQPTNSPFQGVQLSPIGKPIAETEPQDTTMPTKAQASTQVETSSSSFSNIDNVDEFDAYSNPNLLSEPLRRMQPSVPVGMPRQMSASIKPLMTPQPVQQATPQPQTQPMPQAAPQQPMEQWQQPAQPAYTQPQPAMGIEPTSAQQPAAAPEVAPSEAPTSEQPVEQWQQPTSAQPESVQPEQQMLQSAPTPELTSTQQWSHPSEAPEAAAYQAQPTAPAPQATPQAPTTPVVPPASTYDPAQNNGISLSTLFPNHK